MCHHQSIIIEQIKFMIIKLLIVFLLQTYYPKFIKIFNL